MTIDDILNRVTDADEPMIPRPASQKDIALCQKDMATMQLPPLPREYETFLSRLNGFAWNGIEFFSTDQVTDTSTGYMLNDIVSANIDFAESNAELEQCVLLGRADDDLFVFNIGSGHYEALDMSSRDVMDSYPTFEAMFVEIVGQRI